MMRCEIDACSRVISAFGVCDKDADAVFCISCKTLHLQDYVDDADALIFNFQAVTSRLLVVKDRLPSRTITPSDPFTIL